MLRDVTPEGGGYVPLLLQRQEGTTLLKQLLAGVTGLAAAGAVALATTGAASATTPTTPVECPTWTLRSVVNDWGPAADGSAVVDANTVVLTKPVGGGTECFTARPRLERYSSGECACTERMVAPAMMKPNECSG